MEPWFIATEKFTKDGEGWAKYVAWSRLEHLDEVVSLDPSLCPTVLPEIKPDYWGRIVNEDFMLNFFVDMDFLRQQVLGIEPKNFLCVYRNPVAHSQVNAPVGFTFLGYDLIDVQGSASALTNCGGFPEIFSNDELSGKGLIKSFERAQEIQIALRAKYPHEAHANCHLWAIFRGA